MADDITQNKNTPSGDNSRNYLQEELYKKNVELNFTNEFLSLSRELYAMSLLSLSPEMLAEKASSAIREKLGFKIVGIFSFKQEEGFFEPLFLAKSREVTNTMRTIPFRFRDIKLTTVSNNLLFKSLFEGKQALAYQLKEIWGGMIPDQELQKIQDQGDIKSIILLPLLTEERFIGCFLISLDKNYEEIPSFEKEQFRSFADIVAVSLDKAYVYKKLSQVNQSLVEANVNLLRANEELKSLDEMKSSILSSASHHLQNPLQNIVMGTSMILDGSYGQISPEAKKAAAHIFDAARHLTITFKMWLKVLDFENNRVELRKEFFDLGTLAKDTLWSWKNSAEERGLQVFFENDNSMPYIVNADREWMREVLVNVLDNAFKMTEKGFVKVSVKKQSGLVRIFVEDSGLGMSVETKQRLFKKFEKGKEGWKKDIYGTGLGLYLCKKIIEDGHGGKITAESKGDNKGSVFIVEIPSA